MLEKTHIPQLDRRAPSGVRFVAEIRVSLNNWIRVDAIAFIGISDEKTGGSSGVLERTFIYLRSRKIGAVLRFQNQQQ